MTAPITIYTLEKVSSDLPALTELLIDVVNDGASIGFLPELSYTEAATYWQSVCNEQTLLFVAKQQNQIAGTIQLHLIAKANGLHRVEIAKLMVSPAFRRRGIARLLMEHAEQVAFDLGKTLIVLDSREGDPSNFLYQSLGYTEVGKIPMYAKSGDGQFDATVIYYKVITQ
ncbi:GNAT family N-acetyltransferase [Chryseomicrobium palamuruense]|uniref:GNAT family N-acetyltransferase n=1 Tax=Chryseomicrobium palamuruense TaxID=682973 RepID=A0ABV8UY50_9BACL